MANKEVRRRLTGKLKCERSSGANHLIYSLVDNGLVVSWTLLSHNNDEIGPHLIKKMAGQFGVAPKTFYDCVKCTVGRDELLAEAKGGG